MNKKERRLALCSALSSKAKSNNIIVLDTIKFNEIKTKNMVSVLNAIPYTKSVLLVLSEKNDLIAKSASNLPQVKTLTIDYLNIKDLLKYTTLVLLKDSVEKLNNLR